MKSNLETKGNSVTIFKVGLGRSVMLRYVTGGGVLVAIGALAAASSVRAACRRARVG